MKQKRPERVERRRQLLEINLVAEAKSGSARLARRGSARLARRGCALFGSAALLAAAAATFLGLH
jgi:hypothetical protein